MAITQVGFVRYAVGSGRYFRKVEPVASQGDDDSILDDPQETLDNLLRLPIIDKFPIDQPETWPAMDGSYLEPLPGDPWPDGMEPY